MKTLPLLIATAMLSLCLPAAPVHAQDAPVETEVSEPLGLSFGLDVSSAYAFRGLNVFGDGDQGSVHALMAPSVSWTIFNTGLSLGWWSAYQVNGTNRSTMVDVGLGHEQDFILGFSWGFLEDLITLSAAFTAYLYPFASGRDADAANPGAGTTCPVYLEPSIGFGYNGPVELGLVVAYLAGVQSALADFRYLYINPQVGKTFEIGQMVGLRIALGYGYKLFNDRNKMVDNVHDVLFDFELPIAIPVNLVITPGVHLAWTNLQGRPTGDEYLIYGGVGVGYDI